MFAYHTQNLCWYTDQFSLNSYRPEEVALSFNGGKDCTVALHLMRVVLNKIEEGEEKSET